jgi:transcriptional regulator with XRE-family HTH domain
MYPTLKNRTTPMGKLLTDMRIDSGMSIKYAARRSGIDYRTILRAELGTHVPYWPKLEALVTAYGYEIDFIKKEEV